LNNNTNKRSVTLDLRQRPHLTDGHRFRHGEADLRREVIHVNPAAPRKNHGALHRVPQLADIAGPRVSQQLLRGRGGETGHLSPGALDGGVQERPRE
jgi:hypothetical protein